MPRIFLFVIPFLLLQSCLSSNKTIPGSLLIKNIDVIDPNEGLIKAQSVIITDGKISSIEAYDAKKSITTSATIDGTGKYLIPGLWDAHVHFAYMENLAPRMLDLFMIYGITSVRDTGGKIDFVKKYKQEAAKKPFTSPRVMIAGPLLDGTPNVYDGSDPSKPPLSVGLTSEEDINNKVNALIKEEVDLLKAYEMLTPEQFQTITKLARENDLKVTGHVPLSMDVISAAEAGLNSMEHMRNIELSCASNHDELLAQRRKLLFDGKSDPGGILRSRIHNAQRQNAVENFDQAQADLVLDALKANDTWQIPTMALNQAGVNKPFLRSDFQESFLYLPDSVETKWKEQIIEFSKYEPREFSIAYHKWKMDMVRQIHQKGIPIMAGTDCPIFFLTPGLSLHEELAELVSAGLSPLEALKSATYWPAKYFNLEDELGSIKTGHWADLLILNDNPLDDIRNTTKIEAVIKQGSVLDLEKLGKIKSKLSAN
jgi:imidazolonepropionase-like amidohydrolase